MYEFYKAVKVALGGSVFNIATPSSLYYVNYIIIYGRTSPAGAGAEDLGNQWSEDIDS